MRSLVRRPVLVSLCALVGVAAPAGVSARGAVLHHYLPEVSKTISEGVPASSGAPLPGLVTGSGSMAVDSGHLWVAEAIQGTNSTRIDEFDAGTGAFVSQFPQVPSLSYLFQGVAVAHANGDVYVAGDEKREGRVAVFNAAGGLLGVWTGADTPGEAKAFGCFECNGPGGVAVDNSVSGPAAGDVYVSSPALRVVDVFRKPEVDGKEPSVENVGQLTGTCPVEGTTCAPGETIPFHSPEKVAVDGSSGHLLVLDSASEEVEGRTISRSVVDVFEPELLGGYVFVRQIKLPVGEQASNLAVDGGSGEIYVAGKTQSSDLGFVDQFSPVGVFLGRITGEDTPGGDIRTLQSLAVDPESHDVYLGDYREGRAPQQPSVVDVFGRDLVIPDVTTGPASNVTPSSATLTGTVNLDKEGEATCQFVWGTTREFGQPPASCSKPVTEEESSVQATLSKATGSELEPDTTYFYRLQATNKNGLNSGQSGQDESFTTPGPGMHEEAVSNVAATSATFTARINPHNAPTTSYFQYGTSSAYETSVPVAPGLPLGSGEGDVEASPQHVQGLSADTVYHYRVVAVSEPSPGRFEEFDGPDQTFTTQRASGALSLPDGRSWELVTPPEKKGALFSWIGGSGIIQASSGGDAIADIASQPTEAEPQGYSPKGVSVLSTRGAAGWSSQDISPPRDRSPEVTGGGLEYKFFSEDLSLGIVDPSSGGAAGTLLSSQASEPTPYLRTDYLNGDVNAHCQGSCFTPLVTAGNTPPGTVFGTNEFEGRGPTFVGGTPDLSHVVLASRVQLTSTPAEGGLYEWAAGGLRLVSVLPAAEGGVAAGAVELGGDTGSETYARQVVSDDGSRVIWNGKGSETGENHPKHLYLRDMVKGETLRLDLPQGGTQTNTNMPLYRVASSDGSRVFFLDEEHLTSESSRGGRDLYEYDLNAPLGSRLTDLSVDRHANEVANVSTVMGASQDGSYVYFGAEGALAPGAVHGRCGGTALEGGETERCNLYVRHAGVTRLVAALSAEDFPSFGYKSLPVRVSPNGRWLAFTSNRSLTGYDTRDAVSGRPDEEVYLYDANGNRLVCASCNPTGARPVGVEYGAINAKLVGGFAVWDRPTWIAANLPPWTTDSRYQSRYLSDSGRLFFDSNDALVSQDVNGTEDVYEYEPMGVPMGSQYECTSSSVAFSVRSGGCVGLISFGASSEESAFLDASATGGDVFFLTASKLVSQDFDTALDVYDAHECTTGAPCLAVPPISPPACSTGDSCKPAPSPQPALFGSPSSATFSGAGNVSSSRVAPVLTSRALTRGRKLASALRACRKKHGRARRSVCERNARKRYGPAKRSRKANATKRGGR